MASVLRPKISNTFPGLGEQVLYDLAVRCLPSFPWTLLAILCPWRHFVTALTHSVSLAWNGLPYLPPLRSSVFLVIASS